MQSKFAPPERLPLEEIRAVSEQLRQEVLLPWFDAVPLGVLVLDPHRQIVYCNDAFRRLAQRGSPEEVLGLRPGEALSCVHATVEEAGCGCSGFCRLCGAAQAILKSLQGEADCQECRLLRLLDGAEAPMDLQVFTRPIPFRGATYSLLTALDISHEKRLRYLERSFYHDLVNLAGGMSSLAQLMDLSTAGDEAGTLFAQCSRRLLREVLYHRDVALAESRQLCLSPETVALPTFLARMGRTAQEDSGLGNVPVRLNVACGSVVMDRRILGHVLRNMLVNALEACASGGEVRLSCRSQGGGVRISVENPGEMPPDIRKQLFKRYVSSRGPDRGLGAYVMRLLAERYLGGRIEVESGAGRTVFHLDLPATPGAALQEQACPGFAG